jgi:hypothetical protein
MVLALALPIAAVLNVAVAWIAAKTLPWKIDDLELSKSFHVDEHDREWAGTAERGVGWRRVWIFEMPGLTPFGREQANRLRFGPIGDPPSEDRVALRAIAAGWPWPCLDAWQWGRDDTEKVVALTGVIQTGLGPQAVTWDPWTSALLVHDGSAGRGSLPEDVLPLRVRPGAFVANVAVYATALTLLLLGPAAFRGWRRRRGGRCPSCGYDRQATPRGEPCPECGTP